MTQSRENVEQKQSWKFPREFWMANMMELCERAAYYGFFIVLTLYLTDIVGFSDIWTAIIAGVFFSGMYLIPTFVGAISDKIGFKNGLIIAFSLLTIGYFFLGVFHTKLIVIFFLVVILIGASFIKALITGTVAKTTSEINRARGYSLFYWIVNIGAFSGKTVVPYIRQGIGVEYVNFFSAGMSFLALLFAIFFFKQIDSTSKGKTVRDLMDSLIAIVTNGRLITLTIIISGFWMIQHQLYASMPKYVIRMVGVDAKPAWLANVNPAVVVLLVVLITHLFKKRKAVSSMIGGMVLMPFSAMAMSAGPWLESITGPSVSVFGIFSMHPLTVMMIVGIAIQGMAECFISPRFLEYFSFQAPKGEEGLYLGFSHLHSFLSALIGFFMSGFLLDAYCPDPKTLLSAELLKKVETLGVDPRSLLTPEQITQNYAEAHQIWYYFVAIGLISAIALIIYKIVTEKIDRDKPVV